MCSAMGAVGQDMSAIPKAISQVYEFAAGGKPSIRLPPWEFVQHLRSPKGARTPRGSQQLGLDITDCIFYARSQFMNFKRCCDTSVLACRVHWWTCPWVEIQVSMIIRPHATSQRNTTTISRTQVNSKWNIPHLSRPTLGPITPASVLCATSSKMST